jgi:dTDP-4-amino-4,6-dideoxygalactose transaminase
MFTDGSATRSPVDLPAIAGGAPVRSVNATLLLGVPVIGPEEISAVVNCLQSRWIGRGERVAQLEEQFGHYKGAPYACAVSSATAAIHLSLLALGIGPGDEVIAPTLTFCATVNAIVHAGATPVLADCRRETFNIDPDDIERRITPRTKAIIVVHMCGQCCEMESIMAVARRHSLRVIEDCAHAIESTYQDQPAGLIGDIGCFSFYATKSITTADGGMVITRDKRLIRRVRILSMHGMTADAWTRSARGVCSYKVVAPGYKFNMTDVAAALGLVQLSQVENRWKRRRDVAHKYDKRLEGLPLADPPIQKSAGRHAYHLYTRLLCLQRLNLSRDELVAAMRAENIGIGVHYNPVHLQPYYRRRFRYQSTDFPNAFYVGERTFSIPLSSELSDNDVSDVCSALSRILGYYSRIRAARPHPARRFEKAQTSQLTGRRS